MSSENNEQTIIECPICYDEIDVLKNCVTTECGHQFHCKCLMQNSATNGFSCPMCRSVMAEEPEPEPEEDEDEYEFSDSDDLIEDFDDNALTSFRMFHQQLEGEEVEEEPPQIEDEAAAEEAEEVIIKPTAATIATRLATQGFTMEDLVKCLLIEHEEYQADADENDRCADRMFGKFRQIISNYPREQAELEQAQAHQSSRLRSPEEPREEVEDMFAKLQNRYHILQEDGDDDDEV